MSDLKPCPFCGGEARVYEDDDGDWRVYCRDGLTYGCLGYWTIDRFYPTKAKAVAAWNTRAERTCKNIDYDEDSYFRCSVCNISTLTEFMSGGYGLPNYCPNCGAKVVGE